MIRADYHVHTVFSDGRDTPREMVEAALERGMAEIGFSDHAFMSFDQSWCISREKTEAYRREIHALRDEYAGRISVLCGLEQDFFSDDPPDGFDYAIGSCHYILWDNCHIPVDESPEKLLAGCRAHFGGDFYRMAAAYYDMAGQSAEKTGADIVGHFDLITKFNEGEALFSESDPRYIRAATDAVDRLLTAKIPFEINTGAVSRGWRTAPYPAKALRDYIAARGGAFMLSSDSHARETLCYGFEAFSDMPGLLPMLPRSRP